MSKQSNLCDKDIIDFLEDGNVSELDYISGAESDDEMTRPTTSNVVLEDNEFWPTVDEQQLVDYGLQYIVENEEEGNSDNLQVGLDLAYHPDRPSDEPSPSTSYRPSSTNLDSPRPSLFPAIDGPSVRSSRIITQRRGTQAQPVSNSSSPRLTPISSRPSTPVSTYIRPDPLLGITLTEKDNIQWLRQPFPRPIFQNITVPNYESVINLLEPFEYFSQYITPEIIELFTEKTNIYAIQQGVHFPPVTTNEMKVFLGLQITIGTLKFPRLRMYWEEGLKLPMFYKMSRNRFLSIRTNLHLIDNLQIPVGNKDRFIKVRPLYDAIKRKCQQLLVEEYVSVDEQMVPFTGKLDVKMYVKGKPTPYGIKIYCLCGQSGLLYDFLLFQGPNTEFEPDLLSKFGQLPAIVLQFAINNLLAEPHYLFYDNFFSSYNLLEALQDLQVKAGGTIQVVRFGRINKKKKTNTRPPFRDEKELKATGRGTSDEICSSDGKVALLCWYDNKIVYMGSNFVASGNPSTVKRWNKTEKVYNEVEIPELIKLYNANMGGVDKLDQMLSYYRIFIKSKKWTLRMITHGIDLAIANSWLEYKRDVEKSRIPPKDQMDLLKFRNCISDHLINVGQIMKKKRGRPSFEELQDVGKKSRQNEQVRPSKAVRTDAIDHLPDVDKNKEATRCKNKDCKGKTHVFCTKCQVHLCLLSYRNCFVAFHT